VQKSSFLRRKWKAVVVVAAILLLRWYLGLIDHDEQKTKTVQAPESPIESTSDTDQSREKKYSIEMMVENKETERKGDPCTRFKGDTETVAKDIEIVLASKTADGEFSEPLQLMNGSIAYTRGYQDLNLEDVEDISVRLDQQTQMTGLLVVLTDRGATKFRKLTGGHKGMAVAIFIGGKLMISPWIRGEVGKRLLIGVGDTVSEKNKQRAYELEKSVRKKWCEVRGEI